MLMRAVQVDVTRVVQGDEKLNFMRVVKLLRSMCSMTWLVGWRYKLMWFNVFESVKLMRINIDEGGTS